MVVESEATQKEVVLSESHQEEDSSGSEDGATIGSSPAPQQNSAKVDATLLEFPEAKETKLASRVLK